jgi:hypothetical protein
MEKENEPNFLPTWIQQAEKDVVIKRLESNEEEVDLWVKSLSSDCLDNSDSPPPIPVMTNSSQDLKSDFNLDQLSKFFIVLAMNIN